MSEQFALFEEPKKEEIEIEEQPPLFDGLEPKDVDWKQTTLIDIEPKWKELWEGMPEFTQVDQQAFHQCPLPQSCRSKQVRSSCRTEDHKRYSICLVPKAGNQ